MWYVGGVSVMIWCGGGGVCDDVVCVCACGRPMGVVYRDRVSICSCVPSLQSPHQYQVLETLSPLHKVQSHL